MSEKARRIVLEHAEAGVRLRERFFDQNADKVVECARVMAVALAGGGKILFCGNGGSAADAQHLAAEFVNRFVMERPPLPGLALTTDTSALTAIGNDYSFDEIFSKQVQALGRPGDVLVGISTSGNSSNVIKALKAAKEQSLITIGMTGPGGGEMAPHCDYGLYVDGETTALIQEIHIAAGHLVCRLVDYYLFEAVVELQPWLEKSGD
jgi:D-sedoheptulose 7-phosphate isomerase